MITTARNEWRARGFPRALDYDFKCFKLDFLLLVHLVLVTSLDRWMDAFILTSCRLIIDDMEVNRHHVADWQYRSKKRLRRAGGHVSHECSPGGDRCGNTRWAADGDLAMRLPACPGAMVRCRTAAASQDGMTWHGMA